MTLEMSHEMQLFVLKFFFTKGGNLLCPVTGIPVEFDLERTPGV